MTASSSFILQKKLVFHFHMCHTLSISTYQHQYYQQLLPISTFHWLPNKHGGNTRECNVLHNNIYGKNEFSLCFGFVEHSQLSIQTIIIGRVENSENSEVFSEIFKSKFSILAIGQNRKLGMKKTRNNISEVSKISEFSICHFFIFFLIFSFFFYKCFSGSLFYICN